MRIIAVLLTVFTLCMLAGCGGDSAKPAPLGPTGSVDGYVYLDTTTGRLTLARSAGQPVAGATVSVRGYDNISDVTDVTGHFLLAAVPCGAQMLYISCPGYAREPVSITVAQGANSIENSFKQQPVEYDWTVFVYMAADNDLDEYALKDMNEMEQAGSSERVKVLVQLDRYGAGGISTDDYWTDARRYAVERDDNNKTITSPVLERLGEVDMGEAATLRNFIQWGQRTAPAQHYLVVLWNHGSGWSIYDDRRGATRAVCYDYSSNSSIRVADLPGALQGRAPIDVLATDACMMNMLEVGYELKDTADYLVGSEEETPLIGYAYQRMLAKVSTPGVTARQLACYIANDARNEWRAWGGCMQSVLDLSRIDEVAAALNDLAQKLLAAGPAVSAAATSARQNTESFSSSSRNLRDLAHYAKLLEIKISDAEIKRSAVNLRSTIRNAVVDQWHDDYHPHAGGLSIYLPSPAAYTEAENSYTRLALARDTLWDEWLAGQ